MLQDSLSKFKYVLLLALLLVIPMRANAGFFSDFDPIDQTDAAAHRLVFFWDTVDRQSIIQVTNTTDDFIQIHVQVWNASNECEEVNFFEILTPNDTVIYDVENLPGNPNLSDSDGFITVTDNDGDHIIGMFRVIDSSGYEYRTNAADTESGFEQNFGDTALDNALNFNSVNGNSLSDVVGATYAVLEDDTTYASPALGSLFGAPGITNFIFDEFENGNSCSEVIFACADGFFNYGIDNSIPSSQGFDRICNTSKLNEESNAGWLYLPFIGHVSVPGSFVQCNIDGGLFCDEPVYFAGFIGLNNGDGTGSMDSWWSQTDFLDRGEKPAEMTVAP